MSGGQSETPARVQAQPGQGSRYAEAAGIPNIAQSKGCSKRAGLYEIHAEGGGEPFTIGVVGREAWALDRLVEAGRLGCTTIEQPAPRWSAYVHGLRGHRVPIETVREQHGDAFPEHHARYVLRATVRLKGGAS